MRSPLAPLRSVRAGFTLIELLTVIAIIGILAAILIPTIGQVRHTAKNARCAANLREWGRALRLFADENKGNYQFVGWASVPNGPYMRYLTTSDTQYRRTRVCPMLTRDADYQTGALTYSIVRGSINGNLATVKANVNYVELSRARHPSQYLMLLDSVHNTGAPVSGGQEGWITPLVGPLFDPAQSDERHTRHGSRTINGVFGDGSVRPITASPAGSGDQRSIYAMRTTWFQLY